MDKRKIILTVAIVICLVASIVVIGAIVEMNDRQEPNMENSNYRLTVTGPEGTVYPYIDLIKAYWQEENADIHKYYMTGSRASGDASFKPIYISWEDTDDSAVTKYVVDYATKADYSDAITVVKDTKLNSKTIAVYNLYKSSTYYVKVTAYAADRMLGQAESEFETADLGPRLIKIDGLYNVRDMGGYKTVDGKTTLQGMIYRGSEMDGENGISLSPEAEDYLSNVLGIRADLDLRGYLDASPISSAQKYAFGIGGYLQAFSQPELYRKVFSTLANENNYPVYIHCAGGADRTGTVCYLLGALLGMEEEDLLRDYELTSYSIFGDRKRVHKDYAFDPFVTQFKTYEGETLAQKAESYMLSIGVTASEIHNIRAIMLGEALKTVAVPQEKFQLYADSEFTVSLSGTKKVASVTVGTKPVTFTTTQNGICIAAQNMPQSLPAGITQGVITLEDGTEVEFQFTYDNEKLYTLADYLTSDTGIITLDQKNRTLTCTAAIGYGTKVRIDMRSYEENAGGIFVLVGSYGIYLRGSEFRTATMPNGETYKEYQRNLGMSCSDRFFGTEGAYLILQVDIAEDKPVIHIQAVAPGGSMEYTYTLDRRIDNEIPSENAGVTIGLAEKTDGVQKLEIMTQKTGA